MEKPQLIHFTLFNTTRVTILLYGCKSWVVSQDMECKINAFATSCNRITLGIRRRDHVTNSRIYSMTNSEPLVYCVRKRQLRFLGNVIRLPEDEPARIPEDMLSTFHHMAKGDLGVLVHPSYLISIMCSGMMNMRCVKTG